MGVKEFHLMLPSQESFILSLTQQKEVQIETSHAEDTLALQYSILPSNRVVFPTARAALFCLIFGSRSYYCRLAAVHAAFSVKEITISTWPQLLEHV